MKNYMRAIAIDGPAAAGKTTTAKKVAAELGFVYCDTGALYRAIAVGLLDRGLNGEASVAEIEAALPHLSVSIETTEKGEQQVYLNGENVTGRLRTEEVSSLASISSAIPSVRAHLKEIQRDIAKHNDVVMEGRDIGTVILPHAGLKIFLTASIRNRAYRRVKDLEGKGEQVSFEDVLKDMEERDLRDSTRASAPLKPASDAIEINNTIMTVDETVQQIVRLSKRVFAVTSFTGEYKFLSNFYNTPVPYEGIMYRNAEAAFQAAKTLNMELRQQWFATASPNDAKRMGRMVELRPDWEQIKDAVMLEILRSKFTPGSKLAEQLLATKDRILIEGNTWHDNYWGCCSCERCKGKRQLNHLGKLLEKVRKELREFNK